MTHGRVPGRDRHLRLERLDDGGRIRGEVGDARGERLPRPAQDGLPDADGGPGLALVAAPAEDRGVAPRFGAPGRTVWAVVRDGTGTR
ncbi:hypothetical protein [Streptomyces sp. NPDC017202]|uniref:hypothetical protein n=1 Tax=Streptomyces sp. NPDC017202 TaxID=3364981 RepID=UPI00379E416D